MMCLRNNMLGVTSILLLVAICSARDITLTNNLDYTIWVGTQGTELLDGGGWQLDAGQSVTKTVQDGWQGRFWGRTNCNFDGNGQGTCETGDCGGKLQCDGAGGTPPTTLAEAKLNGDGNQDFYDISLVNGFNVPMTISPTDPNDDGSLSCNKDTCTADVLGQCPGDLQKTNDQGQVIGCQATCDLTQEPQACCTGDYESKDTCTGLESGGYFKGICPLAYSFAFDDDTSLSSCPAGRNYIITFGE